jgi:hypothetical protein
MKNPYGDMSQGQGFGQQPGGYPQPPQQPGFGQPSPPSYAPQQPSYAPVPQPGYGQQPSYAPVPQQPAAPPQQGYVSYGQGAAPAPVFPYQTTTWQANELAQLEDDAQLWLLVTAGGFWVMLGWITGPLGWIMGSRIRRKSRALGHHPCSSANWAFGLGIASTLIYWMPIALVFGACIVSL